MISPCFFKCHKYIIVEVLLAFLLLSHAGYAQGISDKAVTPLYLKALADFESTPLKIHEKDQQVLVNKPCYISQKLPARVGASNIKWFCPDVAINGILKGQTTEHIGRSVIIIKHRQPHTDTVMVRIDQKTLHFTGPIQRFKALDEKQYPAYKTKNHDYLFVKRNSQWKLIDKGNEIDDYRARAEKIEAIFQKGNILNEQGKFKKALEQVELSMSMDSSLYQRYMFRADLKVSLEMYESAIADVTTCIERCDCPTRSSHVLTYTFERAKIHALNLDNASAYKDLDAVITAHPDDWEALELRAHLHVKAEEYQEALPFLNKLIKLDNENFQNYYYRGIANQHLKNTKAACDDLRTAIKAGFTESREWVFINCKRF